MIFPLRFRRLETNNLIFVNDAGDFFLSDEPFLYRYASDSITESELDFLQLHGHAADRKDDIFFVSFLRRVASRHAIYGTLSYVILVPTLRCNLTCTYCQVSRVAEHTQGFDWSQETLCAVLKYLDTLEAQEIKIEFQGGEPLLRLDILHQVRNFCNARFAKAEYVVCTNLMNFGPAERAFLGEPDVFISTSLDGDAVTHERNRTHNPNLTRTFWSNLRVAIDEFGPDKISALPTIDYIKPPNIDELIDTFVSFGFQSIYLRPVNYQGFARKNYSVVRDNIELWNQYYFAFIDRIIDRNYSNRSVFLEEYYFTLCLNRILRSGQDFHVDLRNPNLAAKDYILIDYDGTFYPTDEARMVTRVGQIDLSIGDVYSGINFEKVDVLNQNSFNNFHEDCIHCPYQPYCGTDVVDDISRYDRIDVIKADTWFCKRHISIFDRLFSYIYSNDPKVRFSLLRWAWLPRDAIDLGVRLYDSPPS